MTELRINDLKQHAYCPRIVYYQYVMPVDKAATFKMEQGRVAEDEIDALEKRRGLSRYGLDQGARKFHVWVQSRRLGLSGKLDMLIETPEGPIPVDFKLTSGGVHRNHLMQLCGYALILEEVYGRPVPRGFVYLIPEKDAREIAFGRELRQEVFDSIRDIQEMIARELLPPPTPHRNRCDECEFRNYCNDVF